MDAFSITAIALGALSRALTLAMFVRTKVLAYRQRKAQEHVVADVKKLLGVQREELIANSLAAKTAVQSMLQSMHVGNVVPLRKPENPRVH